MINDDLDQLVRGALDRLPELAPPGMDDVRSRIMRSRQTRAVAYRLVGTGAVVLVAVPLSLLTIGRSPSNHVAIGSPSLSVSTPEAPSAAAPAQPAASKLKVACYDSATWVSTPVALHDGSLEVEVTNHSQHSMLVDLGGVIKEIDEGDTTFHLSGLSQGIFFVRCFTGSPEPLFADYKTVRLVEP